MPVFRALTDAIGAAFRSSPVEHIDLSPAHVADVLAEPARFVAEQAGDAAIAVAPPAAQKLAAPETDGDPFEPGWQPTGDAVGPLDGPHWTVDPFAPDVSFEGDPVDLDTIADLADVADVTGTAGLPDLLDDGGLGDAVV